MAILKRNFEEVNQVLTIKKQWKKLIDVYIVTMLLVLQACPTGIDIPSFIKKIASGNLKGSATTIMAANPVGASCARVCPTEELCEGACVLNHSYKADYDRKFTTLCDRLGN